MGMADVCRMREHSSKRFSAVAYRVLFFLRDLSAGLSVFRQIEERIVAESVLPVDAVGDHAFHRAAHNVLGAVGEYCPHSRDEPCRAILVGDVFHALHDLFHLVVVIRVVTEIARGIDAGLAAKGVDHKT